jgi:cytochrome c oxidase subunit II
MFEDLPLFPPQASTFAGQVDALYFFLVAITLVFVILIFGAVIYFTAKYRRRSPTERPPQIHIDMRLEVLWSIIPLILVMISFGWGASVFINMSQAPEDALELRAVGRQWMWKLQHPSGAREINQLHIPVGKPIKVILASEDVIHSFYVPAFRIKMDVIPGRYSALWFEATREGEFHLFCAEYCGTQHSGMIGRVVAMKPADYQRWLTAQAVDEPITVSGERLFQQMGCGSCHQSLSTAQGPSLQGLFGRSVKLQSGQTVVADEAYIRESILNPHAKIVEGYPPVMPTYQGQLSEDALHQIMAYLKTLGRAPEEKNQT